MEAKPRHVRRQETQIWVQDKKGLATVICMSNWTLHIIVRANTHSVLLKRQTLHLLQWSLKTILHPCVDLMCRGKNGMHNLEEHRKHTVSCWSDILLEDLGPMKEGWVEGWVQVGDRKSLACTSSPFVFPICWTALHIQHDGSKGETIMDRAGLFSLERMTDSSLRNETISC